MKKTLIGLILVMSMPSLGAEVCRLFVSDNQIAGKISCSNQNVTNVVNVSKKLKKLIENGYRIDSTIHVENSPLTYTLIKY